MAYTWHNISDSVRDELQSLTDTVKEKDLEIAELRAEIERLRSEVNHYHPTYSPELEDYKKMHPEEQ